MKTPRSTKAERGAAEQGKRYFTGISELAGGPTMNARNQKTAIAQLDALKAERDICRTSADALAAIDNALPTPEQLKALATQHQRSNALDAQIEELQAFLSGEPPAMDSIAASAYPERASAGFDMKDLPEAIA